MSTSYADPAQVQFEVVAKGFDTWDIQFRIDTEELVDQKILLGHLRAIKQKMAEAQRLPDNSLLFDGILSKTRTASAVDVVVRIKKVQFEKGNPTVSFKDGIALDGTRYARMNAVLDMCYLDRFERVITLERVMNVVREAAIAPDLIDEEFISSKVQVVLGSQAPFKGAPIAKGVFPAIGRDAELEFYFHAVPSPEAVESYLSSRKVKRGDLLCRRIPPTTGDKPGRNVLNEVLPVRTGLDTTLTAGAGVILSLDECEITADADGVVVVTRTMTRVNLPQGVKEIPATVALKINPVLTVSGDQVLDITSSQTIEVIGNLRLGSRIITDCEVFVSGNVEEGTLIEAADDVTIAGSVSGSNLNSQSNITVGSVDGSSVVSAGGHVQINGQARNSRLVGGTVTAGSVAGCDILARSGISLGRIDSDESNLFSTICVGMNDFFQQRLKDNQAFLTSARDNLARIEILMGKEIVKEVTAANVQTMLLRFMARARIGKDPRYHQQIDTYRALLQSVPPTRTLIAQKEREDAELRQRMTEQPSRPENIVIIREKIAARAALVVDGVKTDLNPTDGPVTVSANPDGSLRVKEESSKGA
ncbi:MAG TPA: FapA family protein [bacterium]|jgi:hypothetical protein